MKAHFVLCIVGSTCLAACSFHYQLQAANRNGRITFEPKGDHGTGCFANFQVTSEAGEVVWELDAGQYLQPPCEGKLPLTYGVAPKGMQERVKPAALRAGVLYKVEAWDGDGYSGSFRLWPDSVENIEGSR